MIVYCATFDEWRDAQDWMESLRAIHPGVIDFLEVTNICDPDCRGYKIIYTFYPEFC